MTATTLAATILDRCTSTREWRDRAAVAVPSLARSDRQRAEVNGWASEYDDPTLRVRASELETLCRSVLGLPDPVDEVGS